MAKIENRKLTLTVASYNIAGGNFDKELIAIKITDKVVARSHRNYSKFNVGVAGGAVYNLVYRSVTANTDKSLSLVGDVNHGSYVLGCIAGAGGVVYVIVKVPVLARLFYIFIKVAVLFVSTGLWIKYKMIYHNSSCKRPFNCKLKSVLYHNYNKCVIFCQ